MKKLKTISFWQVAYWVFLINGILSCLLGIHMYSENGELGWLAFAFSNGYLAVCLIVVDPEFDNLNP